MWDIYFKDDEGWKGSVWMTEKNHRKLWDEMKNGKDLGYEREVRSSKGGYSRYSIQVQIEG